MKWGTLLVHTGGIDGMWIPKVQYQVLGAHVKVVLWTLRCLKEIEFGNGDGTMEIAQIPSVSPEHSKQTLGEVKRPEQK